jgi:hypothetical protein
MIHAVWGTKNREHYIAKDVRPLLLTHIKEKCLLLQSKNLSMSTSTSYMATGKCAAPERGRGLQNWATNRERMEDEGEMWNVVKSNLEGVVIRPVGANNNTFGEIKRVMPHAKKTLLHELI